MKKVLSIVCLLALTVACLFTMVSCGAPNSDPDEALAALKENGKYVECFYIIERLPNKKSEIEGNFNALCDDVASSIVAEKMEDVRSSLTFEENDFAKSLDVTALEQAKDGADYLLILGIALGILACAATVAAVITIRKIRTKRFHNSLKK